MVTEYIEGYTLLQIKNGIKKGALLSEFIDIEKIKNYKDKIEKAINFSLTKNIIPNDIHPGNILVKENGDIIIIDVGSFLKREYGISKADKRKIKKEYI